MYNVRLSITLGVAGFAVLIYDHMLSFTDEVEYIWKSKKSPVVIMFLMNRYITPIVLAIDMYDKGGIATYASRQFCVTWYFLEAFWYIISFGITHALVAMRVAAMWGRPRWIILLLATLWLAYFCTTLGFLLASLITKAHTVHFEPLLHLCFLTIAPFLWSCWLPPLILEVVLFTLSCVQAFGAAKYPASTPLIYVLFRDGALHFIVIFSCSIFNMVTWLVATPTLVALAKYFGIAIVNVMISRLVLNLRSCRDEAPFLPEHHQGPSTLQIHVDIDEVELDGATWKSKESKV